MIEKIFYLQSIEPLDVYGVNDSKLKIIQRFFPKLKIVGRGSQLKAIGEESELVVFETRFNALMTHLHKYHQLTEQHIEKILTDKTEEHDDIVVPDETSVDAIVYNNYGKPVKAKTPNQKILVEKSYTNDLVFAIGPAGSGKTYVAIALALRALRNKEVKRIVLSRPAVEAGENLGFLPGDLKQKVDPYLQALYDALNDMLPPRRLEEFIEKGIVEIAPLAYMRGRTLNNAFVVLDEAQNTTASQLKMFLTRMGETSKFIVTGDITQIDLPYRTPSGLLQIERILKGIEGIAFVHFDQRDIVRHPLVKAIVEAYDRESVRKETLHKEFEQKDKTPNNDGV